jgi:hypothetical protein
VRTVTANSLRSDYRHGTAANKSSMGDQVDVLIIWTSVKAGAIDGQRKVVAVSASLTHGSFDVAAGAKVFGVRL